MTRHTVSSLLDDAAGRDVAVRLPDGDRTFDALRDRVDDVARTLATGGVGHGSRILLRVEDSFAMLVSSLALTRVGAIGVPMNPALSDEDLAYVAGNADPDGVIAEEGLAEVPGLPDDGGVWVADGTRVSTRRGSGRTREPAPPGPADAASIIYTSGSSARPKGAVLSHAAHVAMGFDLARILALGEGDSLLLCSPLFHVGGWSTTVLPALASGRPVVMPGRFSATRFWEDVERWQPTIFTTGLAFLEMIGARGGEPPARSPFRHVISNLRPDTWQLAREQLGMPLGTYYGMTENDGRGTIALDIDTYERGFVGRPYTERDGVRVTRDGDELATGETGEIELRGPSVMDGYFRDEAETAATLRPGGWLGTGDLGYVDERGDLHYAGRIKNMIKRAGENVSAEEVEALLLEHDDVLDAIVIAVPDRIREEEVKAIVVRRRPSDLTAQALHAYCAGRMTHFKVPRYIEFADSLPRTPSGKPDIGTIRRLMSGTDECWDSELADRAGARR